MPKVRFELNVDEIVYRPIDVTSSDPIFNTPEATGKVFLFVDKMTGYMQAIFCRRASNENDKYAKIELFNLSPDAVIIDENYDENAAHKELMAHIQDCCDKVCKTVQTVVNESYNNTNIFIGKEFDSIKEEGISGNGITEKTLLEALKIVTNKKE